MKSILTVLTVLFAFNLSFAQLLDKGASENKTPEQRAEMRTKKMHKNLELTDEQHAKIYEIHLKHFKEMEALKAEKKDKKEEARKERKEKMAASNAEIDAVLTEQQRRKNDQLKAERRAKMDAKRAEKKAEK